MDIQLKKKHPLNKYKYHILAAVVIVTLLAYLLIKISGPQRLRYDIDRLEIVEVRQDRFMEYLDVEGIVQPRLTIRLNSYESGTVARIVAEEGSMLKAGDTILVLNNPELLRVIEDERDELAKQQIAHRERQIQMERRTSELQRQNLETTFRMERLSKENEVNREEHQIGITSRAQFELAQDEYHFNRQNTQLLQEQLRHDSLLNTVQTDLMQNDIRREERRFERSRERLDNLIVRAPIDGQLSFIGPILGERVGSGTSIGELKVVDEVKITTRISEFYINRITVGQPATITYQGERFPLRIARVNPEIRDRQFEIDLVFTDNMIDDIRIGRSYRIQIELDQPQDALVIGRGNFFQSTGGQWIFRVNDAGDRAVRIPISIGRQNPRQFEILDGLRSGDRVIITGYDNFGDAQEIILR
ncbi:MAG: efflux RND transporter periplasmic adaptor subunit [Dysgonamonadaceae bacterium]|jgi:RND family efflux transporter MFP subunit|nr:efflux RND transporter periplasmic adaptor subunit [Dysgonamonadaceae bacterium]